MFKTRDPHFDLLRPRRWPGAARVLSDEGLAPVVSQMMPLLSADYPLPRKDQRAARGLRLYETFVAG